MSFNSFKNAVSVLTGALRTYDAANDSAVETTRAAFEQPSAPGKSEKKLSSLHQLKNRYFYYVILRTQFMFIGYYYSVNFKLQTCVF